MSASYQTVFGLRVRVGSGLWKWLLRNRLALMGKNPLRRKRFRVVAIARWAAAQPGASTSYLFGGIPGIGAGTHTDCSGFVKAVYARVGIVLPRTSQEQYAAAKEQGAPLIPSDLAFFNYEGPHSHVGIFIGDGMMIADQHTGSGIVKAVVDMRHLDGKGRYLTR